MEHATPIPYLRELVVFLVASGVIVPVFKRLRASPTLGYLFVGAAIGPNALGAAVGDSGFLRYLLIEDVEGVRSLAQLGVVFLLFMIGLDLSPDRLWSMRRQVFGLGTLQVVVTGSALAALAVLAGAEISVAVLAGASLALSSTALAMQMLVERRQVASVLGRTCFAVLLLQDLAVVPILFLLAVLGSGAADEPGSGFAVALAEMAAMVIAIVVLGRFVLRPLFRSVAHLRSRELFMALTLLVVIGTAWATEAAGLSMALGAFMAGLLLSESEFRHEIASDVEPFRGLLLGLFFMSVGMGIDFRVPAETAALAFAALVGLVIVKTAVMAGLALVFGLPGSVAVETGLLLAQGGEFVFVIFGVAAAAGAVPTEVGAFVLIVTSLSMLATPLLAALGRRAGAALERRQTPPPGGRDRDLGLSGHVIVAGFGRVGQIMARILDAEAVPFVALDMSAQAVAQQRKAGHPVHFGDASRPEMLARLNADAALALIVTMDDARSAERAVTLARRHWPQLPIYARARDAQHAARLIRLGATDVVPENLEASLQLAGRVMIGLGVPQTGVAQRLDHERSVEKRLLDGAPPAGPSGRR